LTANNLVTPGKKGGTHKKTYCEKNKSS
jgi:hypothetical protein